MRHGRNVQPLPCGCVPTVADENVAHGTLDNPWTVRLCVSHNGQVGAALNQLHTMALHDCIAEHEGDWIAHRLRQVLDAIGPTSVVCIAIEEEP